MPLKNAQPLDTPSPVLDNDEDLEALAAQTHKELTDDADPSLEREWEKPLKELAENQKSFMETIKELTSAVATMSQQPPRQVERVVERETRPEPSAKVRKWKEKVKPEAAELMEEAIRDLAGEIFGEGINELREKEINPALQYLVGQNETFTEDRLAAKYNHETFGYDALKDDVQAYRKARNFNVDQETAYRQVAFMHMMEAVQGSEAEGLKRTKATKRDMDDGDRVTTSAARTADDNEMDDEERRASWLFFGGVDHSTGKPRTKKDVESLWLMNRRGAKRDQMTTVD